VAGKRLRVLVKGFDKSREDRPPPEEILSSTTAEN
jgi:hypothetical protein